MKSLKKWWKGHQHLVLAVCAFIVAALMFLQALLQDMSLLRGANVIVLVALGMTNLKRHDDGPSEE